MAEKFPSIRPLISKIQLERAIALVSRGAVKSISRKDDGFSGVIFTETSFPYVVSIKIAGEQIYGECSCLSSSPAQPLCDHVAALYLAANPDQEQLRLGDNRIILPTPGETLYDARERELTRRKERAKSDISQVVVLEPCPCGGGSYAVTSLSDQLYQVTLRSRHIYANDCTCPDLEINQLGTCKHIEAALLAATDSIIAPALPTLYTDYSLGIPTLALLPAGHKAANKQELLQLFNNEAPHYLSALDSDTLQTLQSYIDNGELSVSRTARQLISHFEASQQATNSANLMFSELKNRQAIPGFKWILTNKEQEALAFILARPAVLLTTPFGFGKTITTLAAIAALSNAKTGFRALVITTEPLVEDWLIQAKRCLEIPTNSYQLNEPPPAEGLVVASFETALRGIDQLADFKADVLVVDEAQYINNWRSPTGNALRLLQSDRRVVLTSCDLLRDPDALFSIMQIVDQHVLGPLWLFNQRFISFDDTGSPLFRSEEEVLSHLSNHWWRRPLISEDTINCSHLAHCYTAIESVNQGQYLDAVSKLPDLVKKSLLPQAWHHQLDEATRTLYFAPGARNRSPVTAKVGLLLQLWRGLFAKTDRHYVVVAHNESVLNLAAAVNNHLDIPGNVIFHDLSPSSLAAKIEHFQNIKGAAIIFCSDEMLAKMPKDSSHQSYIFFDIPWHPAIWQQRIELTGKSPKIALIFKNSLEAKVLNFYENHYDQYESLELPAGQLDQLAPLSGPLSILLQDLIQELLAVPLATEKTAIITKTAKVQRKISKKLHSTPASLLDLLDDSEDLSSPVEIKNTTPCTAEKAKVKSKPSHHYSLNQLLNITKALGKQQNITGDSPIVLLKNCYDREIPDDTLLVIHQLAHIFTAVTRGEEISDKLLNRFHDGLARLGLPKGK